MPTLPFRGIIPCAHPMPTRVAFDAPTVVGVSAQEAFADLEGECSAPFTWTSGAEETEISVEVTLDKESAVEVSYPVTDTCVDNKLEIRADIVLRTADGKLSVRERSKFKYTPYPHSSFGPIRSAAELKVSSNVVAGAAAEGHYIVRVGGAGPACAGKIEWRSSSDAARADGSWSANGCPVDQTPLEPDSSPELAQRLEQLGKAWQDARLDAAWETGDTTQLELAVEPSGAPICRNHYHAVTVPVEARYGTSDGLIPVHEAPGSVRFDLSKPEAALRLSVEEQTPCSTLPEPAPRYCDGLREATLRLTTSHPNEPTERLTRLSIDGVRLANPETTTQQILHASGTPHNVECLFTFDCPVDELCADGFCRVAERRCFSDSECIGQGGHCRTGVCRF